MGSSVHPENHAARPDGRSSWLIKPMLPPPESLFNRRYDLNRSALLLAAALAAGSLAAFRTFGFDMIGTRDDYPDVADGWGIWYWIARLDLGFDLFFLIVNVALAALLFRFIWPHRHKVTSGFLTAAVGSYMVLWYLFGQARYGTALALIAPAAVTGSLPIFLACGILATLIHKGVSGGVLLLAAWRLLQSRKHGLAIAAVMSVLLSLGVHYVATKLLVLIGYANYLNWSDLPSANTPYKYYYMLAVLLAWKYFAQGKANSLIILALVFLPFSFFNVFAGRSYQMFSAVLLFALFQTRMPAWVRALLLIPFLADLVLLVFYSGLY
jgi:hypothetical protein